MCRACTRRCIWPLSAEMHNLWYKSSCLTYDLGGPAASHFAHATATNEIRERPICGSKGVATDALYSIFPLKHWFHHYSVLPNWSISHRQHHHLIASQSASFISLHCLCTRPRTASSSTSSPSPPPQTPILFPNSLFHIQPQISVLSSNFQTLFPPLRTP